jgi:hypothetical protein
VLLLSLSLIACDEGNSSPSVSEQSIAPSVVAAVDADGDGWSELDDCDDLDADIHPLRAELCDGRDNNCDGSADEGFADTDADGVADCQDVEDCDGQDNDGDGEVDEGMADADGDGVCDALDAEDCDGQDNDGDGEVDEGLTDADGDGFLACGAVPDCDDTNDEVFPGGQEYADGLDNDCDALIDEGQWAEGDLVITELMINPAEVADPVGEWIEVFNASARTVFLDGIVLSAGTAHTLAPAQPLALSPGAYAVLVSDAAGPVPGEAIYADISLSNEGGSLSLSADGVRLDTVTWEAQEGGASWSLEPMQLSAEDNDELGSWCVAIDGEGDRGTPGMINSGCPAFDHDGDGVSELAGDCDDTDSEIHPGAEEVWYDGVDSDCAGDDDLDADSDGFAGFGENALDCDDGDGEIHPDAAEICDGLDNNCDGTEDNDAIDALLWFLDDDSDGYGRSDETLWSCEDPDGYATDEGDCDDDDEEVSPDEAEVCGDGIDNDCDGAAQYCDEVGYPIGGDDSSWSTSGYYRGNVFTAEDDGELLRFEVRLDLDGSCDLDFHVYEADEIDGEWTLLWSSSVNSADDGYHSSGNIDLMTESGMHYGLGVGWSCSLTYYGEYGDCIGDDVGIGTFSGSHYDNSYAGLDDSYVPANVGSGSVAYDQIVYMAE